MRLTFTAFNDIYFAYIAHIQSTTISETVLRLIMQFAIVNSLFIIQIVVCLLLNCSLLWQCKWAMLMLNTKQQQQQQVESEVCFAIVFRHCHFGLSSRRSVETKEAFLIRLEPKRRNKINRFLDFNKRFTLSQLP